MMAANVEKLPLLIGLMFFNRIIVWVNFATRQGNNPGLQMQRTACGDHHTLMIEDGSGVHCDWTYVGVLRHTSEPVCGGVLSDGLLR